MVKISPIQSFGSFGQKVYDKLKRKMNSTEKNIKLVVEGRVLDLELINEGKEKKVYKINNLDEWKDKFNHLKQESVFYVSKSSKFLPKKNPLKSEHAIMKEIKDKLKNTLDVEYLAVSGERLKRKIWNQTTLEVPKGEGNLEDAFKEKGFDKRETLHISYCLLKGMDALHRAGFVHGDSKSENLLIYGEKPERNLKISDFGKARKMEEGTSSYKGNLRFAPPEGKLSKKGEVYSTALMLIRNFEELIPNQGEPLLEVTHLDPIPARGNLRGIEKFITQHADFPGIKCTTLKQKVFEQFPRQVRLGKKRAYNSNRQVNEVQRYVRALIKRLSDENILEAPQAKKLEELLTSMTRIDPKARPSMQEALTQFSEIFKLE